MSKTEIAKTANEEITKKTKKRKSNRVIKTISPNKSNESDTFHSAAGSPVQKNMSYNEEQPSETIKKSPRRSVKRKAENNDDYDRDSVDRNMKKTKVTNHTNLSLEENEDSPRSIMNQEMNKTFEKLQADEKVLNATFEKETENSQKTNLNLKNRTFHKTSSPLLKLNSTYDKQETTEDANLTFEFDSKSGRKSLRSSTMLDKESPVQILNSTFDRSKEFGQPTLNSTYDKETKLNVTDEKVKIQTISKKKSSVSSSEGSTNLTFDKGNDCSSISITSDDSKVDNIVNTTPVLIESSTDESHRLDSSKEQNLSLDLKSKSVSPEASNNENKTVATPLKREGTFTKESSEVIAISPKSRLSSGRTPVKQMSLPSAGVTPFHVSKCSQNEKSILNLTHSIEKLKRRSSLAEAMPKTTKVMFCSPINNPVVVMQQKRKVIKSNLKGSNKSFVFDESTSEMNRVVPRKRSLTNNDVEEARAKRNRLGDTMQTSVDRLSRPRTTSAIVKPSEPSTPSKRPLLQKTPTPSKAKTEAKVSRTKLPNFAALHQKQFDKMESLNECQERRARRAKRLLTPNSRAHPSSPSATGTTSTEASKPGTEPSRKTETPKKAPRSSKKLFTQPKLATQEKASIPPTPPRESVPPTQSKLSTLPTLESLRPGYTRFGFKMHTDENPFSIPPKNNSKPKEFKPNGLGNTVKHALPSLNGTTILRKDTAKQMVMREKSFTALSDKRNMKRKENRSLIKGVRTNRRFELQMQLRNLNA